MEFSRPRPSILLLFDPLSSELDRATSPDSDKENDTSDLFKPADALKHIYVPSRTLKRRLVDVGDITVEHPDMNALLSDELEQEISYIADDDENDTLTFRDMAKAATPKWSSRHATVIETPKVSSPRTPLSEISLKDELTPLARKKPYKRQLVPATPKVSESAYLVFSPSIPSSSSSSGPPSSTEVPEVRVNDEPIPQSSSIPANPFGDSESLFPRTLNQSIPAETLVTGVLPSSLVPPAPCSAQQRTRHLSPTSPTDNANRYSVDLQTSFQIHFPSHDATFDLLKDKVPFFGSGSEFDSYLNNLEGDFSLDDDILIPGSGSKIEMDSGVSSTITSNQVQSVVKSDKLIDHPTPLSKDVGVTELTEPSMDSHTHVGILSLVQPSISNQTSLVVGDTKVNQATLVQPHIFHPPLPLVVDSSRPMSTPISLVDKPRYLPPQIPALRIVKRSKTTNQQKPGLMTKDGPTQDALIPLGCRVSPITEAPALTMITKKGRPSEVSQFQRTDKAHFPPSLASNGPRRVLISEGPKVNLARTSEQVKPPSACGPRRVAMAVPSTVMEGASSSARPPVQPSNGLRQPVKRTGVVKPVQRTAGSRLPAITRRIGGSGGSGASGESRRLLLLGMIFRQRKANLEQFDLKIISPSLHDDPAFSADPHSNPYSVTSHGSYLSPPPPGHPILKNNKKRPDIVLVSHGTPDDSDFQLLQPPNSPNIPSGSNSSPQRPMTTNPLTMYNKLPSLSSASSSMNQGLNPSVMSQGGHRPSLLKKENKLNFFSRRQSAQPQPITSSMGKRERRRSEFPSFPGDMVISQPAQHNEGFPISASVAPQILGQDLDKIDVLDETNPWGIRIHHDGPYEAVNVQVNKRAGHVPLGLARNNGLYNAHALQANDQTYIPPRVSTGMSLNLSPGQILPRHFLIPSIQPAVSRSNTLPGTYTPHFLAGPPLSPPNEPQYTTTLPDFTDSGSQVHNDLPAIQETTQHGDDFSSSIGMAMLKLTDNAPVPSLHTFLSQAESPDEEDFDLFDQHRRVPSPLLSTQPEPSRGQANQSSQNTSSTGTSSIKLDIRPAGHLRNKSDPPMYSEHIDDGHRSLNEEHSKEQRQLQSSSHSSQNSLTFQNGEILAGTGSQQHSNDSDNGGFLPLDRNAPSPPAPISRNQRVEVAQGAQYTSPSQTSTPFRHSHRDGLPLRSVNNGNEPDVQSTHYSASIYSSSQFQSGRRPPNHLPKRLVMPSPLNTGSTPNAAASLHDSRVFPSQISPYVNVKQFQPTPSNQHRSGNLPMAPIQYHENTRAQDMSVFGFGGRKLRKKTSMIVNFAPPIIEFHCNDNKGMAQSKSENKPKRLLSKGKR